MFSSISPSRLMLYIIILGAFPLLLCFIYFFSKQTQLGNTSQLIERTQEMALIKEKRQSVNQALRQHYLQNDHFYIDKNIESLSFLDNEIEDLEKIFKDTNYIENDNVRKRLEMLKNDNKIVFSEGAVQNYPYFSETIETLAHPIEVDASDVEEVLSKIEGIPIGPFNPGPNPPQLIITDFKLEKKKVGEKNEVFFLNLKVLKREYF